MQGLQFIMKRKSLCLLFSLLFTGSSCSTFEWIAEIERASSIKNDIGYGRERRSSLLFSIQNTFNEFLDVNRKNISRYSAKTEYFLNTLVPKDELGVPNYERRKFYIWRSDSIFYFASPNGEVIFSSGFVEDFVQTEDILKVLLIECQLRRRYGVYNFQSTYPTGNKTIQDLSNLLVIGLNDKKKLNEWIYKTLRKNKIDSNSILYWIQNRNRATSKSLYISGLREASLKEEQHIKDYLLKNGIFNEAEELSSQSRNFFKFKSES